MAQSFFKLEAAGGILLVIFAVIALVIANSPLYAWYDYILHILKFQIGFEDALGFFSFEIKKPILLWINDGLMAIFFFLVGLEIKREFVSGELSSRSRALLPFIAAVGGMVVPAACYWFFNRENPADLAGWAIPSATDIAFALGVLSLLGTRAPVRLKILLMAIAVIDDLGAILIIALFYSGQIYMGPLVVVALCLIGMLIMNRRGVSKVSPYVLLGLILWAALLKSGVHATLAGVWTAMFIPMVSSKDPKHSPCENLIHGLHPWVAFGILPLFAFANAGVPFTGMGLHSLTEPVTLGIIAGLVVGKQIGIFSSLWLAVKTGISPMPGGVNWLQLYGVAILCGIGFTMSLFIGGLAFTDLHHQASIRLGVLVGSTISAVLGFALLYWAGRPAPQDQKA
jgi:NhaA family Na+:H+ antiporter